MDSCIVCGELLHVLHLNSRGHQACIVYGGLPPEARREQAKLFNSSQSDPENATSGYSVMVASDAIGMGLNLNIGRVIFTTMSKFDGTEKRPLLSSEAKQIAGRAGRFGSVHPEGTATCTSGKDLVLLGKLMKGIDAPIRKAGLFPTADQLIAFSKQLARKRPDHPPLPLRLLLRKFQQACTVDDSLYFLCDLEPMIAVAELIDDVDMGFADMYKHCLAPVDTKSSMVVSYFRHYALAFSKIEAPARTRERKGKPVTAEHPLGKAPPFFVRLGLKGALGPGRSAAALSELETRHAVVDLWLWLALRFPDRYEVADVAKAREHQGQCSALLREGLAAMTERGGRRPRAAAAPEAAAVGGRRRKGTAGPLEAPPVVPSASLPQKKSAPKTARAPPGPEATAAGTGGRRRHQRKAA
jgi:ATP-dependent RNA helicase SUPV3L1/SUV3